MNPKTLLKDVLFTIVDVETTGLNSHLGDRICEIAVLRTQNGKEVGSFSSLINPKKPISSGASEVNGITDDMVENSPTFDAIIDKILPLLKDSCIVCHNAPFDLSFISTQMKNLRLQCLKNPVVDTLFLARRYFGFPSNALGNIARHLNISPSHCTQEQSEHRAMGDVLITRKIFDYFIKDLKKRKDIKTLEDLLKLQGGSIKFLNRRK
ncbi:MAG: 3'-5' exonuclease [Elusimicrobiota bacterium]